VCVINWHSCLFRKECTYFVTLVCVLKMRTQCGLRIRTFVLIFVTRAGISIKCCPPLLVTIITSESDIFHSFPYPTWTACKFFPTVLSGRLGSVVGVLAYCLITVLL